MTVTVAPRFKQSTRWTAKAIKISDAKKNRKCFIEECFSLEFFLSRNTKMSSNPSQMF